MEIKIRSGEVLLNENTLRSNVKELTDEQVKGISQLVGNSLKLKLADTHTGYDEVLSQATGVSRTNSDESSYKFWPKQIEELKAKSSGNDEYKTKFEQSQTKITELEQQIKDGKGDNTLKAKLADSEALVQKLRGDFDQYKTDQEKALSDEREKNYSNFVKTEGLSARTKITFAKGLKDALVNKNFDTALDEVKREFSIVKDGERTVLKKGDITHTNPNNNHNPYTLAEVLKEKLAPLGILDNGHQQKGGGTGAPAGVGGGSSANITAAGKSKNEVMKNFQKEARAKGIRSGSDEYNEALKEVKESAGWAELPLK